MYSTHHRPCRSNRSKKPLLKRRRILSLQPPNLSILRRGRGISILVRVGIPARTAIMIMIVLIIQVRIRECRPVQMIGARIGVTARFRLPRARIGDLAPHLLLTTKEIAAVAHAPVMVDPTENRRIQATTRRLPPLGKETLSAALDQVMEDRIVRRPQATVRGAASLDLDRIGEQITRARLMVTVK